MLRLRPRGLQWEENLSAIILLLPATIGLVLFSFYPIFESIQISFYNAPLISQQRTWIGSENYSTAYADTEFVKAMANTMIYSFAVVVLQLIVAMVLALLIKGSFKGVGLFRTSFFLPVITSLVVVSTIWKIMYHTDIGLINSLLSTVGLPGQRWLTSPDLALGSLVVMGVWKEVGFSMLVLLGGLNNIPISLYEAASIDGSSRWHTFWTMTLPLMRRAMLFVVVLATVNAFKVFIPIYVITLGGPVKSTQTLVYYIYQTAFSYYKLGYASALSIILLLLIAILAAVQFYLLRSDVEY